MADLLKQRDQVIKSLDFVLECMIQEIEKKSPSIPSKRPMKTPDFQAGENQFIGYHFHIFRKCSEGIILCARNFLQERLNEEQNVLTIHCNDCTRQCKQRQGNDCCQP